MPPDSQRSLVAEALAALGVRHLVLSLHDPSFPGLPHEDLGRGSPYSEGAQRFLAFAHALGFTGVQLGPQGLVSEDNPSPYDSTLFSRNPLNVALPPLTEEAHGALLSKERLEALLAQRPAGPADRAQHTFAYRAQAAALQEAWKSFRARLHTSRPGSPLGELALGLETFMRENAAWLEPDGLYGALAQLHGAPYWRDWPLALDRRLYAPHPGEEAASEARRGELKEQCGEALAQYAFAQFLVHRQHAALRARLGALGLKLFGDLQIGYAPQDAWRRQALFLERYLMGAPPSRTNPEGQPWNYPVLDPRGYRLADGSPGPVLHFMQARVGKLLQEFDGVRVDHPHGLVDPWVYPPGAGDAHAAVRAGARLFSSPDLPGHPELRAWAIARPEQLQRALPRHADGWVRALEPAQVQRYGALLDTVLEAARLQGRALEDVLCEVLSTQPYPLARVMAEHGLGRFRVTQKADLANAADVYRSENAQPPDWVMLGNHDTPPIWRLAERWSASGEARAQADYLAWRLQPEPGEREAFARALARDAGLLVQAKLADLFACPARNVMVFFADLLGLTDVYNAPGTVGAHNWSLRVAPDFERAYTERLARLRALDLPLALALALRARGLAQERAGLIAALEGVRGG
nr:MULTISPECIES: 4-alpha-glucanotransferase [Myxococcaceae]